MIEPDEIPFSIDGISKRRNIRRRLAAILGADIRGYSRLMAVNEEDTHRRVNATMNRLLREVRRSHGRVISHAGDGLMAEFPSAVEAMKCALRVQADGGKRNARLPAERRIDFRIGINSGEVVLQQGRAGGNAVNVAARLEQIADPGSIFISGAVFEQVADVVTTSYEALGERRLKNIRQPVMVYRIAAETCMSSHGLPALPHPALSYPVSRPPRLTEEDYRPSLAVLPFRTLQADRSDAYFAEGMVDDIIRLLGGLKDLLVIARSSTIGYAGAPLDVRRIGHELDVRYVLHGSVRRAGASLRTAVELSATQSGDVIWADRFDGELSDVFDLQDRIALRVATSIAPHLRQRELDFSLRKHPDNMTAYDLTLQALDLFHRLDGSSIERAQQLLEQASMHDPDYAPAYSYMASLRMRWIAQAWSKDELADRTMAAEAARMALERDPNDALGLAIYGHLHSYLMKDYDVARDYLERALAAGPSCAWAWAYSSLTEGYLGEVSTAVARAERAMRLSPLGADASWLEHFLSQAYYLAGRYDDAIAWGRMSAAHFEANTSNLRCLIASLVAAGKTTEAQTLAQQLLRLAPKFNLAAWVSRTPLRGDVRDLFAERLRLAGVPD
nr:adenylate/guanylate cyclase domain-containing protein [uncultured Rhodopila sp.]